MPRKYQALFENKETRVFKDIFLTDMYYGRIFIFLGHIKQYSILSTVAMETMYFS